MFEPLLSNNKTQLAKAKSREGVTKEAPLQAMLGKEAYAHLCRKSGAGAKTGFQQEVEEQLDHYAFLKEEIQRLGDQKDGRDVPSGLQDNIFKALRLLHDLEQMIFRWKKGQLMTKASLAKSEGDDDVGVNLRILNEIQEERAFVTYYIRFFGLGLMPTYKYGLSSAQQAAYPNALNAVMSSTKRESLFMTMHAETDGAVHVETLKNQLMSSIGQLMAFPTGVKILSGLANSMQREFYTPTVDLSPQVSSRAPLSSFDVEEAALSIVPSFKSSDYFVPSEGKNESWLGRKKFAPLTFTTPYLQLAQILDEFTLKKSGMSDKRAFELLREDMHQLYQEVGLECPVDLRPVYLPVREPLTVEEKEVGDFVLIDPIGFGGVDSSSQDSNSSEGEDELMELPRLEGAHRKQRMTYHGLRVPVGKHMQKDQQEFKKLKPELDFSPDDIDWGTFHILGEQGVYGSVYGFKTLAGEDKILKFVYIKDDYLFAFSRNPEKEAFAANFVKSLGRRVDAPATLAIGKENPFLASLGASADKCPNEDVRKKLKKDITKTGQQSYRYSCLVMERMEGVTRNKLHKEYGEAPGGAQLRRISRWADVQASMGELYVYDLILGNFDRFWITIHGGNVMFNVKLDRYNNPKKTPKVTLQHGKPIKAIDQTLSSYGQHIMVKYLTEGKCLNQGKTMHEVRKNNERFEEAAKTTLEADTVPFKFQDQLQVQLAFVKDMFTRLLDNLMSGQLGHTMPIHFLQDVCGMHEDYTALEVGMIEALLRIHDKRAMLKSFSKIQFTEFSNDADYLFETCQMVDSLVSGYNRQDLDYKLFLVKSNVTGL
ncbi:hypothetical protein [Aureibacter tunicatorum]|uniref:Uncharacterized protein n=1 Tax=Aureibacter tunicatorum TaxID=866807 RepID=A0AAE3XKX7_9BACT|nr:hypothetical protein [Aureibacter tunicatorum]MDR6238772.1 hypothetical protein [Aureibacter tunicatorum]